MAKEIVIWCECDLEQNDKRVPAREYEVTIDGKTRTIDLCENCFETHLAPVLKLLEDYGQPVVQKRGPYKTKKKAAAAAEAAPTSPAEPVQKVVVEPNSDGEYECDFPGCGRTFAKPQGLGRHRLSHPELSGFRIAAGN